jgi:hypothetical protein
VEHEIKQKNLNARSQKRKRETNKSGWAKLTQEEKDAISAKIDAEYAGKLATAIAKAKAEYEEENDEMEDEEGEEEDNIGEEEEEEEEGREEEDDGEAAAYYKQDFFRKDVAQDDYRGRMRNLRNSRTKKLIADMEKRALEAEGKKVPKHLKDVMEEEDEEDDEDDEEFSPSSGSQAEEVEDDEMEVSSESVEDGSK